MYPIDFATCTADYVIARSAICHPSLFADAASDHATGHILAHAQLLIRDEYAAKVARGMAADCQIVSSTIGNPDARDTWTFGQKIIAYSIAARLQLIPHAAAQDILSRSDTQAWATRSPAREG